MTVQAQIHTRNITLNDHLATYIEKKGGRSKSGKLEVGIKW